MHHELHRATEVLDLAIALGRALGIDQARGDGADALALIADALEVGDGLDRRHDHAQVAGRGRARRQDAAALLVDRDLHAVDLVVLAGDRAAQLAVAVDERAERVAELLLDESTHGQHPGAHALQVLVEAAGGMVREIGGFHVWLPGGDRRQL